MTRLEAVARELASIAGDKYVAGRVYWLAQAKAVLAIADAHPKDGDVKQAPLVSGGGALSAIAQPLSSPSPSKEL